MEDADPGALLGRAGDDAVEALADARLKDAGRGGLAHLALHLVRRILGFGAMRRQRAELVARVRRLRAGQCGFDQAMRDEIGEAAVRRRRMRVIADRESEVTD